MVRLLQTGSLFQENKPDVSIPQWYDYYLIRHQLNTNCSCFNSSMVRLLPYGRKPRGTFRASFNSSMVRLLRTVPYWKYAYCFVSIPQWYDYYHKPYPFAIRFGLFQFLNGTIITKSKAARGRVWRSFNSSMVRLLHILCFRKLCCTRFQFLNGTIITVCNGSGGVKHLRFNSSMVRLLLKSSPDRYTFNYVSIPQWYDYYRQGSKNKTVMFCFNSSMVRLLLRVG